MKKLIPPIVVAIAAAYFVVGCSPKQEEEGVANSQKTIEVPPGKFNPDEKSITPGGGGSK
jgi:hypothetical protein